jgi:signal transduction histidine kinase
MTDTARGRWRLLLAALIASVAVGSVSALLMVLAGWSAAAAVGLIVSLSLLGFAIVSGRSASFVAAADAILIRTIVVSGMVVVTCTTYLLAVVGFGRLPTDSEQDVLGLMLVATMVLGAGAVPLVAFLRRVATERVYGRRHTPSETLRAFGEHVSRSDATDDLMLELCESLTETMDLACVEIWTGSDGVLARTVSLPELPAADVEVAEDSRSVVARAQAQGEAWIRVWLPAISHNRDDRVVRLVPIAYSGELMGLLVLERPLGAPPFTASEDDMLVDLARQFGMALNNVRLNSALQDSLRELQLRNAELLASRVRIVAAADESRRQIERNLHDGAQQHLVALAVKVGLINALVTSDPETAAALLEELRSDVHAALAVLRELAHGIYPPLLTDRGLKEALSAAAGRSALPTTVSAGEIGRLAVDIEAAVYFCCVEALQNASKYAGPDAKVVICVDRSEVALTFAVVDDGIGFDVTRVIDGHGFVNMRDRLGAFGGSLVVSSTPHEGTEIRGAVPIDPASADSMSR